MYDVAQFIVTSIGQLFKILIFLIYQILKHDLENFINWKPFHIIKSSLK
jgi:hypothetical protein